MFEAKTEPIRLIGPCPKVEQIIRAASGELPQTEMARVGEHVAACKNCAETFRIAGGNVDAWRQFAAQTKPAAPAAPIAPQAAPPVAAAPAASLPPAAAAAAVPARRNRAWVYVPLGIGMVAMALFALLLIPVFRGVSATYKKAETQFKAARTSFKAITNIAGQNSSVLSPSGIQSQLANVSQSLTQMREANAKFRTEVNRPDILTRSKTTVVALEPPKSGNVASNKVLKRVRYSGFTLQVQVKESDKSLEILNSAGAKLWSKPVNPGTPIASVKFGGGSLAPGIYQLRTVSGDGQSASAIYPFQVLN